VRPIESMGMQYREPRARYYETTSSFAKYVGNLLNFSPIKIDHLLEGYLGRQIRLFTGKGGKDPLHSALDMTRQAFVRDFYFTAGRNLLDYYDKKDEVMQKYTAIKNGERPFTEKEKAEVLRNRYLIFGDKNFKGIDDLLKIYREADRSNKAFKETGGAEKLEAAILDLIAQLK